ncbi:MAG: extracellular solute-binding protein [Lachnospiraceae bacterium]|nr:extracellular solute-binding protein [Lachnospiraceae bacterium]
MKKILAILLTTAMVVSMAACGDNSGSNSGSNSGTTNENGGGADNTTSGGGSGDITIWVADAVVDFTQEQVNAFMAAHPDYAGYTVTIESVGEGDAASNMVTDVLGGADIYAFAQDQLSRLISANALMELTGDYASFVETSNDAGAVGASKVGDATYAFPITSDNGYFMFYDSSVVSDPTSLDAILADCAAAGKNFYMEINSGWYATAFFFATGCELTYETDDSGKFVSSNITYASDAGVSALKAMINMYKDPAFLNGSDVGTATNAGAIISGTWNVSAAKDMFGDNYACAKLPSFTVDGKSYQMSGFGGFKLIGVKPQTDVDKAVVCLELAKWLSGEEVQLARYQAVGWGPSNLNAQQNEAVQSDEALAALAEQLAFTIPQGQYPNEYWDLAVSLGDSIIAGDYNNYDDAQLMEVLQQFQTTCESYAQ